MTDLRARLTESLLNRLSDYDINDRDMAESLADALLAMRDVAIVELPEPPLKWALGVGDTEDLYARDGLVIISGIDAISPVCARELAAALLAAANAAEQSS